MLVSLYWALGGTGLLDTVGGDFEELARERSAGALALIWATVALKLAAALVALALVRPWGRRMSHRIRLLLAGAAAGVLTIYGGTLVVAGALVLSDVVQPSSAVDQRALRWHVYLWDAWFLLWGLALTLAALRFRRSPPGRARG